MTETGGMAMTTAASISEEHRQSFLRACYADKCKRAESIVGKELD